MEQSKVEKEEVLSPQSIETTMKDAGDTPKPRNRVPRILHFSDGVIEEYSDEEMDQLDSAPSKLQEPPVDPKTLSWGPWVVHQSLSAGGAVLKVCDYLGESLANIFGITTPKYEYEIEEYKRTMQQEEERMKKEDLEMGGWKEGEKKPPQVDAPAKSDVQAERSKLRWMFVLLPRWVTPSISCRV